MSKNTGGPAFPVADPFAFNPANEVNAKRLAEGMTLRDYFAANVQIDLTVVDKVILAQGKDGASVEQIAKIEAVIRYSKADAMLAERAQ